MVYQLERVLDLSDDDLDLIENLKDITALSPENATRLFNVLARVAVRVFMVEAHQNCTVLSLAEKVSHRTTRSLFETACAITFGIREGYFREEDYLVTLP